MLGYRRWRMKETHARSVIKGITWRITAMADTVTIAWLVTGDITAALKIGSIEWLTKIFLYYLHERAWGKIVWGKSKKDAHHRSFLKGVTWRATGSIDTTMISWFVTGKSSSAFKIGGVEVITKISLFYLHERIWAQIPWGIEHIEYSPIAATDGSVG
jgi:uncharacterized membrane protein